MRLAQSILPLLAAGVAFFPLVAGAQTAADTKAGWEANGPFVRVLRGEDGSRTEFRREPNNRVLTKRTFSAGGSLVALTEYRMDERGNPRSCKIYDGKNNELFKVRYGYDRNTGKLMEEQMFDSRVRHLNPENGEEMPVRRFIYTYDANGQRSKPIAIVLIGKKTPEEDIHAGPSAIEGDPFADQKTTNPRARPLRGANR
jgi:hypothetical protein